MLQHAPQGDLNVVYLNADDLDRAFQLLATTHEPFDIWFRERAKGLFIGLDLAQPLPDPLAGIVFDGGAR